MSGQSITEDARKELQVTYKTRMADLLREKLELEKEDWPDNEVIEACKPKSVYTISFFQIAWEDISAWWINEGVKILYIAWVITVFLVPVVVLIALPFVAYYYEVVLPAKNLAERREKYHVVTVETECPYCAYRSRLFIDCPKEHEEITKDIGEVYCQNKRQNGRGTVCGKLYFLYDVKFTQDKDLIRLDKSKATPWPGRP